jgi:uncharacterized protein (TIGR00375 family)
MRFTADLHLHSKYSRATSPKMNVWELSEAAKIKGLNLLGSGDFTHPKHLADLKTNLEDIGNGFFKHNNIYFVLSTEISNIFMHENKVRKVHNIILAPNFDVVDQINEGLGKWGRLDYDGRPIFGRTCVELAELVFGISKDAMIIPSHCWTPFFSIFGSKSGFDSVKECFQEHTKNIFALETGMSSTPAMNWRLSQLDDFTLVSFSDSHSPYSYRLGREACIFDLEKPNYFEMTKAIKEKDKKKFLGTIETYAEYGKYHFTGHRNCNVSFSPEEAKKFNNICPVCRKQLTIGVEHRVEELADRPIGFVPKDAILFKKIVPLAELLAALYKTTLESKAVWREFNQIINLFGNELDILLEIPEDKLKKELDEKIVDLIMENRRAKLKVKPGYDGVYGELILEPIEEIKQKQKTLGEF